MGFWAFIVSKEKGPADREAIVVVWRRPVHARPYFARVEHAEIDSLDLPPQDRGYGNAPVSSKAGI
ncbi:hypothetical protein HA461_17275 [Rhizobium leguminosarum bv. trifolii]|uniref:hypothetical protein n=1 Tax=Rhizobium leguminosarum TaxID=384 RepID=UPI00140FC2B7|nr:hypothetical protein [Rhizobium leguminosarum]QIO52829.1 hypothetical protein HA461_17275 [Rhizobium leguminosarum bv. trifolii]